MSRSSPRNRSSSRSRSVDLLLLEELHANLPVGVLVSDAKTLEIVRASAPLPGFDGEEEAQLPPELESLVAEVAETGRPRHVREFRHDVPGRGMCWWSASAHRIDTDDWGSVVVALAVDLTNEVRARSVLQERERRRLALHETLAALPSKNLVHSLQQVADALVRALPVDVSALRLLDADRKLHLVAATGLRPAEVRRLTLEPLEERRMEAMIEGSRHPLVGSLGLRWMEIRWVSGGDGRIGTVTVGARSEHRLSDDDLALLDAAAAQLSRGLAGMERSPRFLRSRSLEMARASAEEDEAGSIPVEGLRPRELAILRLYAEGLGTDEIAELLVLSGHTVRTHVRNALRRLGVRSRSEALQLLERTDVGPSI